MTEPFTKHTDQTYEQRDITLEEEQLLAMALANLGEYMHEHSPQYILIEEDPRNDEDYDTWEVGMEPLPYDHTWRSNSIDVNLTELK